MLALHFWSVTTQRAHHASRMALQYRTFLSRILPKRDESYSNVTEVLKQMYGNKLLPLEEEYLFHEFHSARLTDQDFDAKPFIMLMGQYSTGKTSLIKYLIERDYPGIRIGPEPTTDKFIVIAGGDKENCMPGHALVADGKKQFGSLSNFGNAFLNRFQLSVVPSAVLDNITFIDTPGILSGEKQRVDRGYDFTGVLQWFAERSDRIILLFDANKLDISDEFKRSIEVLRPYDEKIRIVLNKADSVGHQELLRIYGALMWSLGKVLNTPEVARVFVGSFWSQPLRYDVNRRLFEDEEIDLFKDIQSLPRNSTIRKINDLSKRARVAKVHAYLIGKIHDEMPTFFGRESKQMEIINSLETIFEQIRITYNLSAGDIPDINKMKELLKKQDFSRFRQLNHSYIDSVNHMMEYDIPNIMEKIPIESQADTTKGVSLGSQGGNNPFSENNFNSEGSISYPGWIVDRHRAKYDEIYESLEKVDGKVVTSVVKNEMTKSKLPNSVLSKIWNLSDVDKDGLLDKDEFALAMYLIDQKLQSYELPSELPQHLKPPSKH